MKYLWILIVLVAVPAKAQTAENVAVVINDTSAASQKIGEYYAKKHGLPASNIIHIRVPQGDVIDRSLYTEAIEGTIGAALTRAGLQDRILYLVLTKGIPLRIGATTQTVAAIASVDSELTLLYRRLTGQKVPILGRVDNPYYVGNRPVSDLRPFNHRDHDIYLVTRLDAFTVDEALALIDRASAPVRDGRIVLDQQDKLVNRLAEDWLAAAAKRLQEQGQGDRVILESTIAPARDITPVLGYYSWGSNDPRNHVRKFDMGFAPGALAGLFVSTDARTFREPPASWTPSADPNRAKWFADSPQSLTGDLIREGVTGVAGNVSEPSLQSAVRPEILFPVYLSGANLAESFYAAMPHLSWQTVVIGDPLCAPFRKASLPRAELESEVDPDTLLPSLFSKRRIAASMQTWTGASERAVKGALRGEALLGRGDRAAARTALEEATAQAPQIASAQLLLAVMFDVAGQTDAAIERYWRVIAYEPNNAQALNNLAYRLAVDKKSPAEALPLAKKAVSLSPGDSTIVDTLAWVQHLLGDPAAVKTMAAALRGAGSDNADVRLHAAIIYAASGARAVAEDQLRAALKLRPALEGSPEVKQLRQQLEKLGESK